MFLRAETGPAHHRLDSLVSGLDLQTDAGRDQFSRMQYRGHLRLARACNWDAAEATPHLRRLVDHLSFLYPDETLDTADAAMDPDAVAYVTLGSQLGLTMMRRGLSEDQRTGVFAPEPEIALWKAFAARTGDLSSGTEAAQRTVTDASRAFDIFYDEALRVLGPQERPTA